MKHTVFYISGLGDTYDTYRRKALKLWSFFGINAVLLPMRWDDGEAYDEKFKRSMDHVERALSRHERVTVVGESAGGSMSVNLFAANPSIYSLVTVAGVNKSSTTVAAYRLRRSPAFAESRQLVDTSLAKIAVDRMKRVHSIHAVSDNMVRPRHSRINGANNYRIWTVGHLFTIAVCLTLLSGYVIRLAKRD
jgi:pimeloyl-ACP methyl ester carboxylesterase